MQRFLFHTLFPEAHSETQAKQFHAPSPSEPSRTEQTMLSFVASPAPAQTAANLQWHHHSPSSAAQASSAPLTPQSLSIIWMWGELVCAKPDRKEQELPFALFHDSLTLHLLVQHLNSAMLLWYLLSNTAGCLLMGSCLLIFSWLCQALLHSMFLCT